MLPDYLVIPEALKSHPELIRRGVVLDQPLNIVRAPKTVLDLCRRARLQGSVYATSASNPPQWVVKVLNPANEEEAIIHRLQRDTSPRNHVIPCEIIESNPTLLVMPYARDVDWPFCQETNTLIKLRTLLHVFHQITEVRTNRTPYTPPLLMRLIGNRLST